MTKSLISCIQNSGQNLSISPLSPSKILVEFPKPTSNSRSLIAEQFRKRAETFKSEIREIRRKAINDCKGRTKDKDEIRNFEMQIQTEFESLMIQIDKETSTATKDILK
jgi:ribosome recycling factor